MARVGGRNAAFAWFAGLVCIAVVGALVWFALPAIPVAAQWIGATLHAQAAAPPAAVAPTSVPSDSPSPSVMPADCRALYSDALWAALTQGGRLITTAGPVRVDAALKQALDATPALTCAWRSDTGDITTTLYRTSGPAAQLAAAALSAAGYTCAAGTVVQCERDRGASAQVHSAGPGAWVATTFGAWRPDGYASEVAARVFPAG